MGVNRDAVLQRINREELAELVLGLCTIPSPFGYEGRSGQYAYDWLRQNGFPTRKVGLLEDRFCVVGELKGSGGGPSLIFNSHLDTAYQPDGKFVLLEPEDPVYNSAWIEGDLIHGEGVINDKGPMACWMIATKAIKESGIKLGGDIIMTMVPGEVGQQPVDEYQGPEYLDKEVSTQYAIAHGAIADYALVAESSGFTVGWIECGKAFFKVTVTVPNKPVYTPMLPTRTSWQESPNPIVKAAPLILALEEWAAEYELKNQYQSDCGLVVPKVLIGAIRGGTPRRFTSSPQLCTLYVDCRILPGQKPLPIKRELEGLLTKLGLQGIVETLIYRPGYEADSKEIEPLHQAVKSAHNTVIGGDLQQPKPAFISMWRDTNPYNQVGIPSLMYGPPANLHPSRFARIDDLVNAARVYALTALNLCGG